MGVGVGVSSKHCLSFFPFKAVNLKMMLIFADFLSSGGSIDGSVQHLFEYKIFHFREKYL